MATLNARPSLYRGIRMRSRLEATAASLLHQAGIDWQYEPVCYADATGQYLPDFELWPGLNLKWFLEVKPPSIWEGWPPPTNGLVDSACKRLRIVRASEPRACLLLWLCSRPDAQSGHAGGRLIVNAVHWNGWNCYPALPWLDRVAKAVRAGQRVGQPS